ncbi:DUF1697 domain-containing protein [Fulvivirgaceae bacterium BMA10]|uniref:DUF1697 domain-containing protein n=1 Tax=Splendidivirga corallicola TaxID=3051826 RepID=A0ABT8KJD9_9BACT|nr:DUF1697 domain-containing protein [Fulvivirgaceae bacterium BMA10]
MQTYIAMLRGINVSGQKKIKMVDLRAYLEELNFLNIQTYIQSGNIIFDHAQVDPGILEDNIKEKVLEKYGFEVPTTVKLPSEFNYVLNNNPFLKEHDMDPKRIFVTFLYEIPAAEYIEKLKEVDYTPEEYILDGKNIFFFSPHGYGKAKMSNNFFENKLKVFATTRNWRTVNKLYEMANEK